MLDISDQPLTSRPLAEAHFEGAPLEMPVSCPAGTEARAPFVPGTREQQRRLLVFPIGPDPLLTPRESPLSSSGGLACPQQAVLEMPKGRAVPFREGSLPRTFSHVLAAFLLLPAMVLVRTADQGALTRCSFGS